MCLSATKWAWSQNIESSTAKFLLVRLADRCKKNEFLCYPGISSLAKDICKDRKTVIRGLFFLEEIGLIKIERGIGKVNKYILVIANQSHFDTANQSHFDTSPILTPVPKRDYTSPILTLPPVPF
jgi:pyocin large subunit-like protein